VEVFPLKCLTSLGEKSVRSKIRVAPLYERMAKPWSNLESRQEEATNYVIRVVNRICE
jgi:hypothetical protein